MNKFLKEFKDRGFFYQCTNEDELSKFTQQYPLEMYMENVHEQCKFAM